MENREAFLAARAVWEIKSWLKEGKVAHLPRLAIKFCGGCNPAYERGEVAQMIKKELAGVIWESPEAEVDLLIMINGCNAACSQRTEVEDRGRFCLAVGADDISEIYSCQS